MTTLIAILMCGTLVTGERAIVCDIGDETEFGDYNVPPWQGNCHPWSELMCAGIWYDASLNVLCEIPLPAYICPCAEGCPPTTITLADHATFASLMTDPTRWVLIESPPEPDAASLSIACDAGNYPGTVGDCLEFPAEFVCGCEPYCWPSHQNACDAFPVQLCRCGHPDRDCDGDVDLQDFAEFQRTFIGE